MQIGTDNLGIDPAMVSFKIFYCSICGGNDMKKFILFFMCTSFLSAKLFATEEILATITNDDNNEVYTFVANSDDSSKSLKAFFKDDYINGKKVEREALSTTDLAKEGVVLDKRGERTVITLKSTNFDYVRGGTIVIDTLYNGVTGERKEYVVELAKDNDDWKLFNGNIAVSKLHIEVNKKAFIGSIGVKNIRME